MTKLKNDKLTDISEEFSKCCVIVTQKDLNILKVQYVCNIEGPVCRISKVKLCLINVWREKVQNNIMVILL